MNSQPPLRALLSKRPHIHGLSLDYYSSEAEKSDLQSILEPGEMDYMLYCDIYFNCVHIIVIILYDSSYHLSLCTEKEGLSAKAGQRGDAMDLQVCR